MNKGIAYDIIYILFNVSYHVIYDIEAVYMLHMIQRINKYIFGCFKQEGKSGPYYSILARSGNT